MKEFVNNTIALGVVALVVVIVVIGALATRAPFSITLQVKFRGLFQRVCTRS